MHTPTPTPSVPKLPNGRRRRPWKLLGTLAAVLLLLAVLPRLLAHTSLPTWIAAKSLAPLRGSVRIGGASLGWLTPVALHDVEVRDEAGRVVLTVPAIESGKSLLSFLTDRSDLGTFRVSRPTLYLECSGPETNLEQVFAAWLRPAPEEPSPSSPEGVAVGVEVVDAKAQVRDNSTGREWLLEGLHVSVTVPRDRTTPLRVGVKGGVADPGQGGQFEAEVEVTLATPAGGPAAKEGRLAARLDGLPLALAEPFLRRVEPAARLDGRLRGQLEYRWHGEGSTDSRRHLDGSVTVERLVLVGPWLEDPLRLERLEVPCRLVSEGSRVRVEQAELRCDLGRASFSGGVDLAEGLAAGLTQPGYAAHAEVDLARLAEALPRTVRLRPDTRITSGRVDVQLGSSPGPDGVLWKGTLRTSALTGVARGQSVNWPEPLAVTVRAHRPTQGLLVVDQLRCESDFLHLEAAGSLDRLTATARCDLDRLAAHLARFLDLGPIRLAGQCSAQVEVRRGGDDRLSAQATLQVHNWEVAGSGSQRWREDQLALRLDASGIAGGDGLRRVDGVALRLSGAVGDEAELRLLEPITDFTRGPWGPVQVHVRGDVARWQHRLGTWLAVPDGWRLAGRGELAARLKGTASAVNAEEIRLAVRDLRCQAEGFILTEPVLDLKAAGHWQQDAGRLELRDAVLTSTTVSVHAPRLQAVFAPGRGPELTTRAGFRGDLARFQRWLQSPDGPVAGQVVGQVEVRSAQGRTHAALDLTATDVTYGAAPAWREPRVRLLCQVAHDPAADVVQIEQVRLESAALTCDAAGRLGRPAGSRDLSLAGKLEYDLEKLAPLWRPYLGDQVQIVGRDARPFRVEGALAPAGPAGGVTVAVGAPRANGLREFARLTGEAGLSWQGIHAFGLRAGPAELHARLEGGRMHFKAVECTLNEGRLRLEPSLRLEPGPAEFYLAKGSGVDRVRLTPELCASWLGYVAPVVAGAAEADGRVSLAVDGGRVLLDAPAKADLEGRLTVHAARLGAGPLVRELAVLLSRPASVSLSREAVVPFRVGGGRVYHRDLELVFPELTVRTHGSVGFDGTLALTAEMPVPPKWLGSGRANTALAGQTVRLPIGGTLQQPKLDEHALRAESARFLKDAAGEVLRQEMSKQLDRLVRPKK